MPSARHDQSNPCMPLCANECSDTSHHLSMKLQVQVLHKQFRLLTGCRKRERGTRTLALVLGVGEGEHHAERGREHLQADEQVLQVLAVRHRLQAARRLQDRNEQALRARTAAYGVQNQTSLHWNASSLLEHSLDSHHAC